ncbi:hypothetical protein [Sphingobacterium siyangense]|uniref:Lipoprotein n=1 Tax=Sphingobacterium siyangense TaxID=459529 RepID=A0A562MGV5_9SPHI|nr:hypothetical protein [Sphingobacterium siyangense]TWI19153.1 hypothetical protein IQ31_02899 [Sphingobacterium siyangense]
MKKTIKKIKKVGGILVALMLSVFISSCSKDQLTYNVIVTEPDAINAIRNDLLPSFGGYILQVNNALVIVNGQVLKCGDKKSLSTSNSKLNGTDIVYSYALDWTYELNCLGTIPSLLIYDFKGSNEYDAPNMKSKDGTQGHYELNGLENSKNVFTLNTDYTRTGTQTSKIGDKNSFTSKLIIHSSNIVADKNSLQIKSGNASVKIDGTSVSGDNFSYEGTIEFLGNNKAKIILNSGQAYIITW